MKDFEDNIYYLNGKLKLQLIKGNNYSTIDYFVIINYETIYYLDKKSWEIKETIEMSFAINCKISSKFHGSNYIINFGKIGSIFDEYIFGSINGKFTIRKIDNIDNKDKDDLWKIILFIYLELN